MTAKPNARSARRRTPKPPPGPTREQLYADMVMAVRRWVRVAHPNAEHLDIADFDSSGSGTTLAQFHADPRDPYVRGDDLAREGGAR